MPWVACSDPDMPNYCTPANVGDSLRDLGYTVYGRGRAGWRTLWAGDADVKVDHPAAALPELHTLAELLHAAGWETEVVQPDGWVRVSGKRDAPPFDNSFWEPG